jgi:hypothetical protein
MMVMTSREQRLMDTQRTRADAAGVLSGLLDAKARCEATLAQEKRPDVFKVVAGRSSLESAIAETRRLLETLDRQISEAVKDLDEEDHDVFTASEGVEAVVRAGRIALRGYRGGVRVAG